VPEKKKKEGGGLDEVLAGKEKGKKGREDNLRYPANVCMAGARRKSSETILDEAKGKGRRVKVRNEEGGKKKKKGGAFRAAAVKFEKVHSPATTIWKGIGVAGKKKAENPGREKGKRFGSEDNIAHRSRVWPSKRKEKKLKGGEKGAWDGIEERGGEGKGEGTQFSGGQFSLRRQKGKGKRGKGKERLPGKRGKKKKRKGRTGGKTARRKTLNRPLEGEGRRCLRLKWEEERGCGHYLYRAFAGVGSVSPRRKGERNVPEAEGKRGKGEKKSFSLILGPVSHNGIKTKGFAQRRGGRLFTVRKGKKGEGKIVP